MTSERAHTLLATAIPGKEIIRGKRFQQLAEIVPQAWKFWRSDHAEWAAFVIGEVLSSPDSVGIHKAKEFGLSPVIVVPNDRALKAAAPSYRKLAASVVCEIAGEGCLIPPPTPPHRTPPAQRHCGTRVSIELLRELGRSSDLPNSLHENILTLVEEYQRLPRRNTNDVREGDLLLDYAVSALDTMGLDAAKIAAASMMHTMEQAKVGPRRDHFFHSFQNYFLGLLAVKAFPNAFQAYQNRANLHWKVDPFAVWFLTAMWHDIGYSLHALPNVVDSALGPDPDDEDGTYAQRFLNRVNTQNGLRIIASLLAHLLYPARPSTDWMSPGPRANLGAAADKIREALIRNVNESHGAIGGLRLYCDYQEDLDKMDPGPQTVLRQTVLLASCSIPFHDLRFRAALREFCGDCKFRTTVFPFATLLAFIDSLQDDRRDLDGIKSEMMFLERLLLEPPATVSATVDQDALADPLLLKKIIEGRDVLASCIQSEHELYFRYPEWIANQA